MILFLYCVDKQITQAIVLHVLIYTCSYCKENNHQSSVLSFMYALFFLSGFSHKKNEDDVLV